jgi:hypothetical protein
VVDLLRRDGNGALNASSPAPSVAIDAAAWLPLSFFGGQLETTWRLTARHERGLADGPWAGLLDGDLTTVGAVVSGTVGSASFYVEVDNVMDTSGERVPGRALAGRGLTAGFSWDLWD